MKIATVGLVFLLGSCSLYISGTVSVINGTGYRGWAYGVEETDNDIAPGTTRNFSYKKETLGEPSVRFSATAGPYSRFVDASGGLSALRVRTGIVFPPLFH